MVAREQFSFARVFAFLDLRDLFCMFVLTFGMFHARLRFVVEMFVFRVSFWFVWFGRAIGYTFAAAAMTFEFASLCLLFLLRCLRCVR